MRVQVSGAWYTLRSLDGWSVEDLTAFARDAYGPDARRRIEEDLVELLVRAGHPPAKKVVLGLQAVPGGMVHEVAVEMTEENRRRLRDARRAAEASPATPKEPAEPGWAVRELAELLATRDAYAVATGAGDRLREIAREFSAAPNSGNAAEAMLRLVGSMLDGHASVAVETPLTRGPWIPMLVCPVGDVPGTGLVAVKPDRSGFLDPAAPFVKTIHGVPVEDLVRDLQAFIADGSAALCRERACRMLSAAAASGVPPGDNEVEVRLAPGPSSPVDQHRTIRLKLTSRRPDFGGWPRASSRPIDHDIAYLRLDEMDDTPEFLGRIEDDLRAFSRYPVLVIDVRGNRGGRRDALVRIASWIMDPDDPPLVYNVARPLRLPGDDQASMDSRMSRRFMRRRDDPAWNSPQREAIDRFVGGFRVRSPSLVLTDEAFGPWYYALVEPRRDSSSRVPGRRVLVLMDNACFSATDVWLSAMSQITGVTLIGRPSAGGSGLAMEHRTATGVTARLSSMVSFTPEGNLFDGRGVCPDITVWPIPTDFLKDGTDSVLDAALVEARRRP